MCVDRRMTDKMKEIVFLRVQMMQVFIVCVNLILLCFVKNMNVFLIQNILTYCVFSYSETTVFLCLLFSADKGFLDWSTTEKYVYMGF